MVCFGKRGSVCLYAVVLAKQSDVAEVNTDSILLADSIS